ncbi:MAG: acetyl-CoA carboxylase, carboxyltransferase subunit beta [Pseudomonadota bacterium]|nr:acetyl-CoA carboxylase, carboxyltransferase subunit beta [Pseudomonadota bacterium]
MNWIKNFVRPKLQKLVGGGKEIPDNLWQKCPECSQMIFHRDLKKNLYVCQHCGYHMRLAAKIRMDMLFDDSDYKVTEIAKTLEDPLAFRDRQKYSERLKVARDKTGEEDALLVAHGTMSGLSVVVAVLDFQFMGGSMGIAVGESLLTAARLAVVQDAPLIVIPSSGGARMQEGIHSLMQLPRTTIAIQEVHDAGLPYIVVLADPTTGGVSASFAMLGDIAIAEPGAIIGFAGARVIEQTIRETLPDGFQRSEYLYEHGMVDMVVHRKELRETLIRVLSLLRNRMPAAQVLPIGDTLSDVSGKLPNIHPPGKDV